ncbi:hypothetical protein MAR_007443 [Mya arenaria]|uniref:Uncharacterized protein n=1 Tax=Mya arenaria TaxID=6604 RepID=A0ABY7DBC9_MYAAR|nr:hypothetical protein MAR_007443 [Mya arenaria]
MFSQLCKSNISSYILAKLLYHYKGHVVLKRPVSMLLIKNLQTSTNSHCLRDHYHLSSKTMLVKDTHSLTTMIPLRNLAKLRNHYVS